MKILKMIETMNANYRVGVVMVGNKDYNPISIELIQWIHHKYRNLYWISIEDDVDELDIQLHE